MIILQWWVIAYTNEDSVTVNERKRWTHSTKLEVCRADIATDAASGNV